MPYEETVSNLNAYSALCMNTNGSAISLQAQDPNVNSRLANGGDYHWYRQNMDGTWSHKLGQGNVKNVDDSENPQVIYDPVAAAATAGYTELVGFYAISPWDHFYGDPSCKNVD